MSELRDSPQKSESSLTLSTRPSSSTRNVTIFGLFVIVTIFLGVGFWSATAPLARAVSAYATLTVKGERKQIQHFEGGIVDILHVTEGQMVEQGDLLVSLNPLQASALVARHDGQLDQSLARAARMESELQGARTINLSGRLLDRLSKDPKVFNIVESEERHLTARRETLDGTITILLQRKDQLENEIKGLKIQRASRLEQLKIFEDELVGLRELFEKGYYPKTKILAVERAISELRGAAGNDLALISRAKSARGEAENQIVSVRQRFREDAVKQLRDAHVEISDLKERLLVAKDVLQRIDIRAPRTGIIQGIKFHTVGGVVRPGDVLMDISPKDDDLIVDAQVLPTDIDNVAIGQQAEIRLTALNLRTTPAIFGYVISVSGDSLIDPRSNAPYFRARVEIPKQERAKLDEGVKLTAGMPVDVLIQTGERTALDYILKPIMDGFARGLNED
jgi:HlyD family secretion protein/epimerase transport system membrane fusion protein